MMETNKMGSAKHFASVGLLLLSYGCGKSTDHNTSELTRYQVDAGVGPIYNGCEATDCQTNEVRFYFGMEPSRVKVPYIFLPVEAGKFFRRGDVLVYRITSSGKEVKVGTYQNNQLTDFCNNSYENTCDVSFNVKRPGVGETGYPVYTISFKINDATAVTPTPVTPTPVTPTPVTPTPGVLPSSKTDLIKYIIPSPNQQDGATCLYMASTGTMEILLNKKTANMSPVVDGATDLSERYLIRKPARSSGMETINNFNGSGALNRVLPYVNDRSVVPGEARSNWDKIDISGVATIALPQVQTYPLAGKMSISNQDPSTWEVAKFDANIIQKIKREVAFGRPVMVNYNHFGYWHVVIIVGYDDNKADSCSFVTSYINSTQPAASRQAVKNAYDAVGGCAGKGVFYVRDSLGFADSVSNRAKNFDARSYQWVQHLANKVISVEVL